MTRRGVRGIWILAALVGCAGCSAKRGPAGNGASGSGARSDGVVAKQGPVDAGGDSAGMQPSSTKSKAQSDGSDGGANGVSSQDRDGGTVGNGRDAGAGDGGPTLHHDGGTVGDGGSPRGSVTVSAWDALPLAGQFATDNTGRLYGYTATNVHLVVVSATSTATQDGPIAGLLRGYMQITSDNLGNLFTVDEVEVVGQNSTYQVRRLGPSATAWEPTKFTGDVTINFGLRRDRLGNIYVLNTANSQLLQGAPGGDAFTTLPGYPIAEPEETIRSVSADRDGIIYAALNGSFMIQGLSLAPGAKNWQPLPDNPTVTTSPVSVEVDAEGNVYEIGGNNAPAGNTAKLPAGAGSWVTLSGGPTHDVSRYSTNMVADDTGDVFVVGWDGKTGYSLFELPAGSTIWTETAISGPVFVQPSPLASPDRDIFQRLAIDAKNRLIVSIWDDYVYRSEP